MKFVYGAPPDDSDFTPEQGGWQKLRVPGPRYVMLVGSLAGLPLGALFIYFWSQILVGGPSAQFNLSVLGPWGPVVLPLLALFFLGIFLAGLIVAHELIHALACPGFGLTRTTVFGVWPSKFMAYAAHTGSMPCWRGVIVGLSPFLVLSVVPLLMGLFGGLGASFWALVSILNALMCGGDIMILILFVSQVPLSATVRNSGWDTWWRPAEPGAPSTPAVM